MRVATALLRVVPRPRQQVGEQRGRQAESAPSAIPDSTQIAP
ncbi:hypothetical protein [Thauera humireducens]